MADKFWLWATKPFRRGSKPEATPVMASPRGSLNVRLEELGLDFDSLSIAASLASLPAVSGSLTVNPTLPTILYEALLSGSDATLYTATANWRDVVIYLVNVDTVDRTATLYRGNPGADNNTIIKEVTISTTDKRYPVFLPALASGDKINGLCSSANKVKIEIWGTAA